MTTPSPQHPQPTPSGTETMPSVDAEISRAKARRAALGIARPTSDGHNAAPAGTGPQAQWALALSGGGIRSATFCLGVLQSLATTADPGPSPGPTGRAASGSHADAGAPPAAPSNSGAPTPTPASTRSSPWPLLAQFDYLSTVSGGGYIGGFFSSLFVRGRLSGSQQETALDSTRHAYQALAEEPPGRIHRDTNYEPARPGRTALSWLRDNGRYMAPSATGDLFYGITIAVRNWFATQYVVATVLLVLLSVLQLARWCLAAHSLAYNDLEAQMLDKALHSDSMIWWSPSWVLSGVLIMLVAVPLGIAFWFSHPSSHKGTPPIDNRGHATPLDPLSARPEYLTRASAMGMLVGTALLATGCAVLARLERPQLGASLTAAGLSVILAVLWYGWTTWRTRASAQGSITQQRVVLTRWLTQAMLALMVTGGLATIETVAQTAWLWLSAKHGMVISGALATQIWLLREAARRLGDSSRRQGTLKRLPLGVAAGVLGSLLWLTVAAALNILLLKVVWPEGWPDPQVLWNGERAREAMWYALAALGLSSLMAIVVGRFPGFLNLSTLQSLYSARITRAYLGASNHARFTPYAGSDARDVAEPIKGDSLAVSEVYSNPLAPIHYVNVCVNQSVSPGEQLVQRDRKGKPLVVAPGGIYLDQQAFPFSAGSDASELAYPLSFGEWLGVSGAAFSTGLGRGTDLGVSLALGFANVRLGRWWKGLPPLPSMSESRLRRWFPTQAYLLDELRGLFYGDHRPLQYLSDGGHFENMAVYELLRTDRQRQVRLIVVCDCGCDPDYQFEDLANLTRLVRIDHGLEIRVHRRAHGEALLNQVFARPEDFARNAEGRLPERNGRCAIMLDVVGTARSAAQGVAPGALFARIILIKPTLLAHSSVDIDQYQARNPTFPQETTMDQFFDEAQWESYRQLGMRIGQRVFTADGMPGYPEKLWQVCMDGLPT